MKKGIIVEENERFLTMLTPEGEFLRARKPNYHVEIGQEMTFFPYEVEKKSKLNFLKGKAFVSVAIACVIAFIAFIPFLGNDEVYAYMSIDVNPSIEIGVNDELKVINLTAYNDDGRKIIEQLDKWENKNVGAVASNILSEIKEAGYFERIDEVLIGTVYTSERKEKTDRQLVAAVDEIKREVKKDNIVLTSLEATTEEREDAKKEGITASKLIKKKVAEDEKEIRIEKQDEGKQKQSVEKQIPDVKKYNEKQQQNPQAQDKTKQIEKKEAKGQPIPPGLQKKIQNDQKSENQLNNEIKLNENTNEDKKIERKNHPSDNNNGKKNGHQKDTQERPNKD